MSDNVERINQVYYTLFSQPFGLKVIQEPKGWQSDYKSYERDTDSRGIQSKVNIDLEFFGDGATYLKDVYDVYGINVKIILTKHERDTFSLSERFKVQYTQTLDLTSYDYNHDTKSVKVKATQGDCMMILKTGKVTSMIY